MSAASAHVGQVWLKVAGQVRGSDRLAVFLRCMRSVLGGLAGGCVAAREEVGRVALLRNAGKSGGRKGDAAMTQSGPPAQGGVGGIELAGFDASVPNPARMWNYWVGGQGQLRH
jgi:hypothetical protein